ncbi:elongation factor P--(R)-beta-lysine ligase [bacterium BMS3Bbin14]|nr:elongation factor P--(R)-beta-lysine ligase [bacterium BMS3Bbin14]
MISPRCLAQRSSLLQAVRSFFIARRYLEVDTPARLPVLLPESYILPFTSEGWFLQTSPELCMKRLLARGCPQLFQICHCFRRQELGRYHQPEFTMLEWYHTGWSYLELMAECEDLVRELAGGAESLAGVCGPATLRRDGQRISLAPPWERLTVEAAFLRFAGMPVREALDRDCFDELMVTAVEPHLGRDKPVFLYDYPAERAALARRKKENDAVAERFELYIAGIELANGFSELVNPAEQRQRFAAEISRRRKAGEPPVLMPERFLDDLGRLDETAGIALGLDRLFMVLLGAETVADVVSFAGDDL